MKKKSKQNTEINFVFITGVGIGELYIVNVSTINMKFNCWLAYTFCLIVKN